MQTTIDCHYTTEWPTICQFQRFINWCYAGHQALDRVIGAPESTEMKARATFACFLCFVV